MNIFRRNRNRKQVPVYSPAPIRWTPQPEPLSTLCALPVDGWTVKTASGRTLPCTNDPVAARSFALQGYAVDRIGA